LVDGKLQFTAKNAYMIGQFLSTHDTHRRPRFAHFLKYQTQYTVHYKILGNFPFAMGCLGRPVWPILVSGRQT
jgi:hypothetical protein